MKILYIDCSMGAAGDMLTGALLDLLSEDERKTFAADFNSIGIPGVEMNLEPSVKCGVSGTHVHIRVYGEEEFPDAHEHSHAHAHDHNHEHHHHGAEDVEHIVRDHLDIPESVKRDVLGVYEIIADAESKAHGVPVSQIHFHEVGELDAIADITAVCLLMERIGADRIIASPVNTGSGTVKCAHGIIPVPAPATANILEGIPSYHDDIRSELCTPTGAALLKFFVTGFGPEPAMKCERTGHGMGTKDLSRANCVTITLGEAD